MALRTFIYEEMVTVFNATHALVTQWDSIGSRDRRAGVSAQMMTAESGGNTIGPSGGNSNTGATAGATAGKGKGRA